MFSFGTRIVLFPDKSKKEPKKKESTPSVGASVSKEDIVLEEAFELPKMPEGEIQGLGVDYDEDVPTRKAKGNKAREKIRQSKERKPRSKHNHQNKHGGGDEGW